MPLWVKRKFEPRSRSPRGSFEEFIEILCFSCLTLAPVCLVLAFGAARENRIVATTPASDAVVDRLFRKPEKGRPLYVSISFFREGKSGVICSLDVPARSSVSELKVGGTIRVVRTSSGCDAPILVGRPEPVGVMLVLGLGCFACASGLFFFHRYLAGLRMSLEPLDGAPV